VVIAPGVRDSVDQVRAAAPVSPQAASAYTGGRILVENMEVQQIQPAPRERQEAPRRAQERRKEQLAVTIDTRVAQRRLSRRRASDEPPGSIDVQA
jgi:hypothetical protein